SFGLMCCTIPNMNIMTSNDKASYHWRSHKTKAAKPYFHAFPLIHYFIYRFITVGFCFFLDSSRGKGNDTFSGVPSRVRTEPAPNSFSLPITCWTKISGADAPAVTPTVLHPSNHLGSIISGLSSKYALAPSRSATSRRRLELELLGLPTTSTRSHFGAIDLTAS